MQPTRTAIPTSSLLDLAQTEEALAKSRSDLRELSFAAKKKVQLLFQANEDAQAKVNSFIRANKEFLDESSRACGKALEVKKKIISIARMDNRKANNLIDSLDAIIKGEGPPPPPGMYL